MDNFFYNKNVLVTGVTGSLGSVLSKALLDAGVKRLAGIARRWQSLQDLETQLNDSRFRPLIADIRDLERLRIAFRDVDCIFHCAALKGLAQAQRNPTETIATNILGTQNVLMAAQDVGVERVMVVTSDKACQAENIYGASKSACEHLAVSYNSMSQYTRYSCGRWGNVFASSGSVVPIFRRQKESGILKLTSDRATRFWIEMPEAVKFAMRCMVEMKGGEVFVPKLPASRIVDLAEAIAPEAEIQITGLVGGEKTHEVMVSEVESQRTDDVGWAYRINPTIKFWDNDKPYPAGSPVPWGWEYSSASATRLTVEQLRSML